MTLRFGNKVRLAPADRWRLMTLTGAEYPGAGFSTPKARAKRGEPTSM